MAAVIPTQVLGAGYAYLAAAEAAPAEGIFIALTDLPNLDATEADATTGNGAKVLWEIAKEAVARYNALAAAAKSPRLTLTSNNPTAAGANLVSKTLSITTQLDISGADVADEPSA